MPVCLSGTHHAVASALPLVDASTPFCLLTTSHPAVPPVNSQRRDDRNDRASTIPEHSPPLSLIVQTHFAKGGDVKAPGALVETRENTDLQTRKQGIKRKFFRSITGSEGRVVLGTSSRCVPDSFRVCDRIFSLDGPNPKAECVMRSSGEVEAWITRDFGNIWPSPNSVLVVASRSDGCAVAARGAKRKEASTSSSTKDENGVRKLCR
jgi:hypothetical protein